MTDKGLIAVALILAGTVIAVMGHPGWVLALVVIALVVSDL